MKNERGITFLGIIKYISSHYGEDALEKIIENLPEDDKVIMILSRFEPSKWYPAKTMITLMETTDKLFGKGDYEICYQMGKAAAENTFKGLYRALLQIGNPKAIIKREPLAWRLLFTGGSFELEEIKDKYARAKIVGVNDPRSSCAYRRGYFEKILELTGARNVKLTETKCCNDGYDYCEYEVTWE